MTLASCRSIEALLAPMAWATFVAEHYARRPVYVAGAPGRSAGLMSWPQLEAALASHRVTAPRLLPVGDRAPAPITTTRRDLTGQRVTGLDPVALAQQLHDGHALVLREVEQVVPGLRSVADAVARGFGRPVEVEVTAAWGEAIHAVHADPRERFIVQVAGRSRWRDLGRSEPADPADGSGELELAIDDVLYIPGDHAFAVRGGEPSLYVTLAFTSATGVDLVTWFAHAVADDLIDARLPCVADPIARRDDLRRLRERVLALLDDALLDRYLAAADPLAVAPRITLPR
ncbi:MAG: cupin domain-containing protein [Deltaproteobacteria bacterium]|nr:cupin domain-containing protein [Deltaproteobacteria bacterium]